MLLDTPTILISLMLINLMSAGAIFWAWFEHPTVGQRNWSLSMLVESAGLLLIASQSRIPDTVAIIGGYTCLSAAFVFRYLSLTEFFERRASPAWVFVPPMTAALATIVFFADAQYRIAVINLIMCIQSAALFYIASTSPQASINYSRKMLIGYTIAASGIFLFRGVAEIAARDTRASILDASLINSITLFCLLLLAVLSSFSILLILREKLDAENRKLATLDPLTNICNRRALMERAERELLRGYRTNRWPCLLMLDIDHFKEVNDRLGHQVGDLVLVELARLLENSLRDVDIVGRYGGEEFFVLLAESDEDGGLVSAERLREAIRSLLISHDEGQVKVTVSIGLACARAGDTLDQLIHRADLALYQAKSRGRNQVFPAVA